MRFIGSLGYAFLKLDGEPSMRMLLEVAQQAGQRFGFHTNLETSGPAIKEQWKGRKRDPDGERPSKDYSA